MFPVRLVIFAPLKGHIYDSPAVAFGGHFGAGVGRIGDTRNKIELEKTSSILRHCEGDDDAMRMNGP